jgi:hypothetical protein
MTESKHYVYSWNIINDYGFLIPFYIGVGHNTNGYYSRSYVVHRYGKNDKTRAQYKREKYANNVYIVIEYDNLSLLERNIYEQYLISEYRTIDNHGTLYNHTAGGEFNPMFDEKIKEKWYTKITTDEYREKQRNATSNNWKRQEYREKCESKTKLRERNNIGQFSSKKSIDEIHTNMILGQKTRKEMEYCGQIFPSKKALARFLGISSQLLNTRLNKNIQLDSPKKYSQTKNK